MTICSNLDDFCRLTGLELSFVSSTADRAEEFYDEFERKKKSGGSRQICASTGQLKHLQRWILDHLLVFYEFPEHVHGCVPGRSIVTNAEPHTGKEILINIDLSNFFGAVTVPMVRRALRKLGMDGYLCDLMTKLTTYKGCLPQGAPTSPALANLVALELDNAILSMPQLMDFGEALSYTRYVDDLSISGPKAIEKLLPDVLRTIREMGFDINEKKVSIKRPSQRQSVTGIVVNQKPNPPRSYVRRIRQQLYFCKKYGIEGHCQRLSLDPAAFVRQLRGLIGFVGMTQPALAFGFEETLDGLLFNDSTSEGLSPELQAKIALFESLIKAERVVAFQYEGGDEIKEVAPSEVILNSQGEHLVKGFQLEPKPGWRTFYINKVRNLSAIDV